MMQRVLQKVLVVLIAAVCITVLSCSKEKSGDLPVKEKATGAVAEGKTLYRKHCQVCHGRGGIGNICPNLTDAEWKYGGTDEDLFKSILKGRPEGMPAWENKLSKDNIDKLIAYIRSLSAQ